MGADEISTIAAAVSAVSALISLGVLATSLWVARRDRARILIRPGTGVYGTNAEVGLVITVANIGRRPIGINHIVSLKLDDGNIYVLHHPSHYHGAPENNILVEGQSYMVILPLRLWRESQREREEEHKKQMRCVSVLLSDQSGKTHEQKLERALSRVLNETTVE